MKKKTLNTIAINYVIAQSDGYQSGYAQALSDFTKYIIDYWNSSDDKPQQSVIDALIDLGTELGERKEVVKENIKIAEKSGYKSNIYFLKIGENPYEQKYRLFVKPEIKHSGNVETYGKYSGDREEIQRIVDELNQEEEDESI